MSISGLTCHRMMLLAGVILGRAVVVGIVLLAMAGCDTKGTHPEVGRRRQAIERTVTTLERVKTEAGDE